VRSPREAAARRGGAGLSVSTTTASREQVLEELLTRRAVPARHHENPDGDALGSLIAMRGVLAELGKGRRDVPCPPPKLPLPYEYGFRAWAIWSPSCPTTSTSAPSSSWTAATSSRNRSRLGVAGRPRAQHRPPHDNTRFGHVNHVDDQASCTRRSSGTSGPARRARDRRRRRPRSTSARHRPRPVHVRQHVEPRARDGHPTHRGRRRRPRHYRYLYEGMPYAKLLLLGRALTNVQRFDDGCLTLSWLSTADFRRDRLGGGFSEGVIDLLRASEGTKGRGARARPARRGQGRREEGVAARHRRRRRRLARRPGQGGGGHRRRGGLPRRSSRTPSCGVPALGDRRAAAVTLALADCKRSPTSTPTTACPRGARRGAPSPPCGRPRHRLDASSASSCGTRGIRGRREEFLAWASASVPTACASRPTSCAGAPTSATSPTWPTWGCRSSSRVRRARPSRSPRRRCRQSRRSRRVDRRRAPRRPVAAADHVGATRATRGAALPRRRRTALMYLAGETPTRSAGPDARAPPDARRPVPREEISGGPAVAARARGRRPPHGLGDRALRRAALRAHRPPRRRVLELELAEPSLFFAYAPGAADASRRRSSERGRRHPRRQAAGATSHDVVAACVRLARQRRVLPAGTLDPSHGAADRARRSRHARASASSWRCESTSRSRVRRGVEHRRSGARSPDRRHAGEPLLLPTGTIAQRPPSFSA